MNILSLSVLYKLEKQYPNLREYYDKKKKFKNTCVKVDRNDKLNERYREQRRVHLRQIQFIRDELTRHGIYKKSDSQ
jgi:hypothetical protein